MIQQAASATDKVEDEEDVCVSLEEGEMMEKKPN